MISSRTQLMIGEDGIKKLNESYVVIFGAGAVGGYVLEGLVRAGVGKILIVDGDTFNETNLNRQILATVETIGKRKVDVAIERAKSINPNIEINGMCQIVTNESIEIILKEKPDIVVDAIDTVEHKASLLKFVSSNNIQTFSSMGAALRFETQNIKVATLKKTKVCPLASNIRSRLKDYDTSNIVCVYSEEPNTIIPKEKDEHGKSVLGSLPTIPAIFGMTLANEAIKYLIAK